MKQAGHAKKLASVAPYVLITVAVLGLAAAFLRNNQSGGNEGSEKIRAVYSRTTDGVLTGVAAPVEFEALVDCIQTPAFTVDSKPITCETISSDSVLELSVVKVDTGRCSGVAGNVGSSSLYNTPYDIHLRRNSSDGWVFNQAYCSGDFHFLRALQPYMPPEGELVTILDAGANTGIVASMLAASIRFNGEIIAVEANPGNLVVLKENVAHAAGTITVVGAAITTAEAAERGDTLDFAGKTDEWWGFRVNRAAVPSPGWEIHKVQTVSLPMIKAMARSKRLDFIKLDIEGEEKYLFEDPISRDAMCEARCLFMELHEFLEVGTQAAFDSFIADGCSGRGGFQLVVQTGEYKLICRPQAQ